MTVRLLHQKVHREIRQANTRVAFKVVYPDKDGKYVSSPIGSVSIGKRTQDDASRRSLDNIKFKVPHTHMVLSLDIAT